MSSQCAGDISGPAPAPPPFPRRGEEGAEEEKKNEKIPRPLVVGDDGDAGERGEPVGDPLPSLPLARLAARRRMRLNIRSSDDRLKN